MNILSRMRIENTKSNFWLLLLLSPAFILGYSLYSISSISSSSVIILPLVAALILFHSRCNLWFGLLLSAIVYGFAIKISPFVVFGFPFFIYALVSIYRIHASKSPQSVVVGLLLIGFVFSWIYSGIEWMLFDFGQYHRALQFYAGFTILLLISLAPLFLMRPNAVQLVLFITGFISLFSLIGFGLDWGYCLSLFCTLLFLALLFDARSIFFKQTISRISLLVVVLYALLWSIPNPFIGMPGLGIYGALYHAYPRLEIQDPLKHPFWREAAERYNNVQVGIYRNGMPPDTSKLEFLLKRTGVKNIQLLTAPNAGVVAQPPNSQTFYVLDDWSFSPSLRLSPDVSVDLLARIDGYLVYAPGWKVCKTCREIAKDLQIASIPAEVNLNKAILFGKGGEGAELLGSGWSQPEIWGVWSDGELATIFIPKPEKVAKKLHIDLRAFVSPANPIQDIAILVNDQLLREYKLDKGEGNLLTLDLPASTDRFYKITFQIRAPTRPFDLGLNKDKRLLGIGLISAKLE
jgi:hypothetical protein